MPSKISGYEATQPLTPIKGSNGNAATTDKASSDAPARVTPATQSTDQVTLTASARSLQKISEAIATAPVVNAAKVTAVKQALSSGTYKVDAARITDKLLKFERGLK